MEVLLFKNKNKNKNNNKNKTNNNNNILYMNTTPKPNIYGDNINNNKFRYRHIATPNKISKI